MSNCEDIWAKRGRFALPIVFFSKIKVSVASHLTFFLLCGRIHSLDFACTVAHYNNSAERTDSL